MQGRLPKALGILTATIAMALVAGCSYGPVRTSVDIGNAEARPGTHVFAMATTWKRLRDPEGFLATFPDGGASKVIEVEARVHLIDVASRRIVRVAQLRGFAGIPNPSSAHIEGWQGDELYFRLVGYGGNSWQGNDSSDQRRLFFRVSAGGLVAQVPKLPARLERASQSGPTGTPPFLRLSRGNAAIDIGIDGRPRSTTQTARIVIHPDSGEPTFEPASP